MQIGPMYAASGPGGQPTVIDAGKMGILFAFNAKTGKLEWKTPVGEHNGHDNDGRLLEEHKIHLKPPYTLRRWWVPAFGSSLSKAQIKSVALFVSSVAGKPMEGKVKKHVSSTP